MRLAARASRRTTLTRDHTENMLAAFGAEISVEALDKGGEAISLMGEAELTAVRRRCAARSLFGGFCAGRGADRAGFGDYLAGDPAQSAPHRTDRDAAGDGRRHIEIENERESGGEKIGDLAVRASALEGR